LLLGKPISIYRREARRLPRRRRFSQASGRENFIIDLINLRSAD
jgi:hypothetical protein